MRARREVVEVHDRQLPRSPTGRSATAAVAGVGRACVVQDREARSTPDAATRGSRRPRGGQIAPGAALGRRLLGVRRRARACGATRCRRRRRRPAAAPRGEPLAQTASAKRVDTTSRTTARRPMSTRVVARALVQVRFRVRVRSVSIRRSRPPRPRPREPRVRLCAPSRSDTKPPPNLLPRSRSGRATSGRGLPRGRVCTRAALGRELWPVAVV